MSAQLKKSDSSLIYSLFCLIDWLLLRMKCYPILPTHSRTDLKASGKDHLSYGHGFEQYIQKYTFPKEKKYQKYNYAMIYGQWLTTWQEDKGN